MLARHAAAAFGGTPSVRAFVHDALPLAVDILACADGPGRGVTAYSTVGLSDYPMVSGGNEFPARLEVAGVMESAAAGFHEVLGSVAFRVMRTREVVRPGTAFADYVAEYFPGTHLPHLYFTAPFYWEDALGSATFGEKRVSWLLGIPISDAEFGYLRAHGDDAFETLLEAEDADTATLTRASAV